MLEPNQTPTFTANIPDDISGDGDMASLLAGEYIGHPLTWQRYVLDVMLARDERDKYSFETLGLSVPRQNGKSWIVRARCLYGAVNGEKILYTCHHGDTADEMFQELSAIFEDEDNTDLHDLLNTVRKTNGQQAIKLKNGGIIRFTTRSDSLARGKTYDVLIYDEAQELTATQQAASLPAISAGKKQNPQTIYLGTPPQPGNAADVFRNLHDDVHSEKSAMAWIEWGITKLEDVSNEELWYLTNPSLDIRIIHKAIKGEFNQMQPDAFARERLGWFSPIGGQATYAINSKNWSECTVIDGLKDGKLGFGVKFSVDGSTVAVSWARAIKGAGSYVELFDIYSTESGTAAISDMLIRNKDRIAAVCIDGKAGTSKMVLRLKEAQFPLGAIIEGTPKIVQSAASILVEEVNSKTLTHIESPALDDSATKSLKRKIGNDGWGFGDGDNSISAPIESASLALYAARTTKRDPDRIQEASF